MLNVEIEGKVTELINFRFVEKSKCLAISGKKFKSIKVFEPFNVKIIISSLGTAVHQDIESHPRTQTIVLLAFPSSKLIREKKQ